MQRPWVSSLARQTLSSVLLRLGKLVLRKSPPWGWVSSLAKANSSIAQQHKSGEAFNRDTLRIFVRTTDYSANTADNELSLAASEGSQ